MQTEDIFQSKLFKGIIIGIGCLIILGFVFSLGIFVGTKKADFSFRWAEEYHNNFAGPQNGFFMGMMNFDDEFTSSNGVFGQIIKVDSNSITVKDNKDNVEKIVLIDEKTSIIKQRQNIKLSNLKVGDNAIVIGEPNDKGQIQAGLIRILPPPPLSFKNIHKFNEF